MALTVICQMQYSDYAAIEIRNLTIEQGLQTKRLIKFLCCSGPSHEMEEIAISWAQLLVDTGTPIFEDKKCPLPHLYPMCWIPAICTFLAKINSKLHTLLIFSGIMAQFLWI